MNKPSCCELCRMPIRDGNLEILSFQCSNPACECHDVSVKMKCPRVEMFGRCSVKGCGTCNPLPFPTKPSGWESSFNDAFLLRKNKWGAPKLAKYFPQQLHPDLVKDFIRSLLREKAGEIRRMKNDIVSHDYACEQAARIVEDSRLITK